MNMLDILSYVGYVVLTTFAITGGLIWTRWGLVGVQALWHFRKVLDATVLEDFESHSGSRVAITTSGGMEVK